LKTILNNRIKEKIKQDAQELINKLNEAFFQSKLWLQCQHKWLFLEKVFANYLSETNNRPTNEHFLFAQVAKEFKTFQFRIVDDPIVINIIERADNKISLIDWLSKLVCLFFCL
jgi:hypothetical protein